jgi:hypothetical protein
MIPNPPSSTIRLAGASTDNQPKDDSVRNVFHAVLRNKNTFKER